MLDDPRPIFSPSRCVHHQHVVVGHAIHDEIVPDTAVRRAHGRILALANLQDGRVVDAHELNQIDRLGATDHELAHVRNVEEARRFTYGLVLRRDPRRVLDRHLVPGERHHLGSKTEMHMIERSPLKRVVHALSSCSAGSEWSEKLPLQMTHR